MTAVVGTIAVLGGYRVISWAHAAGAGFMVATLSAATYLLVGLGEELWLRGYALTVLVPAIGFWPAAAVLSAAFGILHDLNVGEWPGSELLIAFAGLGAFLSRRLTGSLWFNVGVHACFDYGQSILFSGPDSGVNMPAEHLLSVRIQGSDWITGGTAGFENSAAGMTTAMLIVAFPCRYFARRRLAKHAGAAWSDSRGEAVAVTTDGTVQ